MSLTAEQIQIRSTGIGGSDAAAALGLNPYRSPVELWREKRGLDTPFAGNEATRWGQLLEPAIRQEYAERTGRVVRLPTETQRHPKAPFALCHPDGITDDRRLYEGKTARYPDGWGEPGTDEVPQHYLIQVQHNLMVMGLDVADLAVLIGGQDFRIYEIPADRELQEAILDGEADFWRHVERGEPPPVDCDAPGAIAVLKKLYPGTNGQVIEATEDLEHWRRVLEEAAGNEKTYKGAVEAAKAHLLAAMGEAALLRFADGKCFKRSLVKRKGYEVKATEYIDARLIDACRQ